MIDLQILYNIGAGALLAIIGFFARRAVMRHDQVSADLMAFRLEVAKEYVTHTHLQDIKNTLIRIETKLDAKQDK